jgi:hypothetical protein
MATVVGAAALLAVFCYCTPATSATLGKVKVSQVTATSAKAFTQSDIRVAARLASRFGTVSSMLRTRERNQAVGGAPNSYHLVGRAIDIARRAHIKHLDIHRSLVAAGFDVVESLDEGDHSHFAFGVPTNATPKVRMASRQTRPGPQEVSLRKGPGGRLLADEIAGTLIASARRLATTSALLSTD